MAPLQQPVSGLVIGYSYLWEAEYRAGQEEGTKDRPCAVVIATRTEDGDIVVTVAPITHSPPADTRDGIELPPEVKRRLHLDVQRIIPVHYPADNRAITVAELTSWVGRSGS